MIRKLIMSIACLLSMHLGMAQSNGRTLSIGDPAPPLEVFQWLKGGPVTKLEKGKVYVMEFWATWCGPCIAAMPHLSELARQYRGKVEFVGVSVWEGNGKNIPEVETIQKFVDQKGSDMDYIVGMDDPRKNAVSTAWLKAAGLNGIPATFIVNKEGKIAWIGHPSDLDKVLKDIVEAPEKYDLEEAKVQFKKDQEAKAKIQIAQSILGYGMARNYGMAFHGAQKQMKEDPDFEKNSFWVIVRTYMNYNGKMAADYVNEKANDSTFVKQMDYKDGYAVAKETMLDEFARAVAQHPGLELSMYYDAIVRLHVLAQKTPADYTLWSALAEGYIKINDPEKAILAQEKVLELYLEDLKTKDEDDMFAEMMKKGVDSVKERLEEFKNLKVLKSSFSSN